MCMEGHAFLYLFTTAHLVIIARPMSYAIVIFNVILVQMTMHMDAHREASFAMRLSAVVILIAPLVLLSVRAVPVLVGLSARISIIQITKVEDIILTGR